MATRTTALLSPLMRQMRPRALRAIPFQTSLRAPKLAPIYAITPIRAAHTIPRPPPKQSSATPNVKPESQYSPEDAPSSEGERPELKDPAYYQLSFTCVPCGHRSHHNVSKQGYHKGSTLITCPSCRNRHVISDHLNIFGDRKLTVEDLMREKGQLVKRGSLGEDGDVEFWPDEPLDQQADGETKTGSA